MSGSSLSAIDAHCLDVKAGNIGRVNLKHTDELKINFFYKKLEDNKNVKEYQFCTDRTVPIEDHPIP
jgi:hypothetical protein